MAAHGVVQAQVVCNITTGYASVNIRSGAGINFGKIDSLEPNESFQAIAQEFAAGYNWWQLANSGYVRSDVVIATGSCFGLPAPATTTITTVQPAPAPVVQTASANGNWLSIPAIGIELPLTYCPSQNGTWDTTNLGGNSCLLQGMDGLVGLWPTGVAGHAYDAFGSPLSFSRLGGLTSGDRIYITFNGQIYEFQVVSLLVATPDNAYALRPTQNNGLTLLTCTGRWVNSAADYSQRQLVYATRV